MASKNRQTSAPQKKSQRDPDAVTDQGTDQSDDRLNEKIEKNLKGRAETCGSLKRTLYAEWKRNVDLRMGRLGSRASLVAENDDPVDELQSEINPDWYLSKAKIANLFSQVPQVMGTHEASQYGPAIPPFMKQLNYELGQKRGKVGVAMREVMADIVNAAGIGFVFVDYVARFADVETPTVDVSMIDPRMVDRAIEAGLIPTELQPMVVSDKFSITRVAPMSGLWPTDFAGSDFDDADFMGFKGQMSEADAAHAFDLDDAELRKAARSSGVGKDQSLRTAENDEQGRSGDKKVVEYERLFYWRHRFDKDEESLEAIWEIVYIKGISKAVRHEPWSGQRYDKRTGRYLGCRKFPVRVGTLTYISDNPLTPSDTAAARPQTNDLRRSRSQLFQQRARSTPLRWYNVNQVGLEIQSQLNDGTFQGMIPINGTGERAVGEVARASYPGEDLTFDQETTADMLNMWGLTPGALGLSTPGRKTVAETQMTSAGFSTNIGSEKLLMTSFFLGIVETVAGLMSLYSEFEVLTPEQRQIMDQTWDRGSILVDMALNIRPDSMIALDPQVRIQRLMNFLNMTVKSGYVAPKSIIVEIAELTGLDPAEVIVDPTPKQPDDPQLSYRFSGKDDLTNPLVLALLMNNGRPPNPQQLEAAKQLLLMAQQPAQAPQPGGPGSGGPTPVGAGATPAAAANRPPGAPAAAPPHPQDAETNTGWALASKIAKRSRDMNAGQES